jgi:hypothetical protein
VSGRAAETSGRMEAGIEASLYSGGSERKTRSSGWMMLGLSGRPDGMARRPDGWTDERPDGWTDERPNGMARSSGRLTGNRLF